MKQISILITGVGGPTPRSFALSLKLYSNLYRYRLIGTDANPLATGLYMPELFDKTYVVPPCSAPDYWEKINTIVKDNQIEAAVILPEQEVMEWSRKRLDGGIPCKSLLPDHRLATMLVDKAEMTSLLSYTDLVPKSYKFSRQEFNCADVLENLAFPFWVRSSSGTSGLGSLKVHTCDELSNWISINPTVATFLASEFLPGRNLACKLLYWNGELIRAACAERVNYIMAKVAPSGITGNTSFGRLLNEPHLVDRAQEAMDILFKASGATKHGFFTIDWKEDMAGCPKITEVNVRHVAFTQCFASAGANFAEATVALLDENQEFNRDYRMFRFEEGLIFLRDVDVHPIVMRETDILR